MGKIFKGRKGFLKGKMNQEAKVSDRNWWLLSVEKKIKMAASARCKQKLSKYKEWNWWLFGTWPKTLTSDQWMRWSYFGSLTSFHNFVRNAGTFEDANVFDILNEFSDDGESTEKSNKEDIKCIYLTGTHTQTNTKHTDAHRSNLTN